MRNKLLILLFLLVISTNFTSSDRISDKKWKKLFTYVINRIQGTQDKDNITSLVNLVFKDEEIEKNPGYWGINGGIPCATCTILLGMSEQLADINNGTLARGLDTFCSYLPDKLGSQCSILIHVFGPSIIDYFNYGSSPDEICYDIGVCVDDTGTGQKCHLFPVKKVQLQDPDKIKKMFLKFMTFQIKSANKLMNEISPWICYIPGIYQLCEALDAAYNRLQPSLDLDGDGHSPEESLRGSIWRGRDCADSNPHIYPGHKPYRGDFILDTNCNGILGQNETSGVGWEEELCGGSGARGVVYIGDSVGAHFHVPPQWFTPQVMDTDMFVNISQVISNEGDWPDISFATGFRNSTMPTLISGVTDSIYLRLRERNLCNHRDYHNLARNGATSGDTVSYMKSLARSEQDLPAIVFYSLIGNDVCKNRERPEDMTTPEQFYKNTMTALKFLDKRLAPDSHVMLVGLIDAAFLWDAMSNRYHPLGLYRKNIKYKDVYGWFNCMEIGPCAGWMNSNATMRAITSKRARELNSILRDIADKKKFDKFDVFYLDNPLRAVIDDWVAEGGEVYELIEPVDSMHPTQAAQPLIAQEVWNQIETRYPHVLGPVNPHNRRIRELFGDQGGH